MINLGRWWIPEQCITGYVFYEDLVNGWTVTIYANHQRCIQGYGSSEEARKQAFDFVQNNLEGLFTK